MNLKTLKLAKKQITWFKKEKRLKMIETDNENIVYKEMIRLMDE